MKIPFFAFAIFFLFLNFSTFADSPSSFSFGTGKIKPQDYLFSPNPERKNDLFDGLKPIEAEINLGIGFDCGKINIEGTLRSTFGKVLNGNYFKGLAQDILGSAPMLAACYMSPTWCSILKHTQLSANFLTDTRLNQCQIIDKYTDSRVEDYYRERQTCVHRAIQANGGDMDAAMASCQGNVFESKAGRWAGPSKENPNKPNALIEDSVAWAGFDSQEGGRITDILKSMVGDMVLAQGNVRVEYGPKAHSYSPRSYLIALEQQVQDSFCRKLLPEIGRGRIFINDADIERRIASLPTNLSDSPKEQDSVLAPDLVRNLAFLPPARRDRICLKLSQALAMNAFSRDMNRSLDVLTAAAQNPNLPPNRKQEIENKRTQLKDQIEVTLRLRQEQSKPLGEVMQYIAQEGLLAHDEAMKATLNQESDTHSKYSHYERMNDCSDGIFCNEKGRP